MAWIKRNLYFVIGAAAAVIFMAFAGVYLFSGLSHNSKATADLEQAYEELKRLNNSPTHPGDGRKVDNIKLAREQQQEIRQFLGKAVETFVPIPPIPSENPTSQEYAAALRATIDRLKREATNNSVVIPPGYNFSFQAQSDRYVFAEGSLPPLARQLGEVKVICDILNDAKVNSFDGIRRERVSTDDSIGSPTDYLDVTSVTNDLAILTPYEITFRSFSPELADVLAGFANSPHAIVVKSVSVEPAGLAAVDPLAPPGTVAPIYTPQPYTPPATAYPQYVPPQSAGPRYEGERAADAFRERYGSGGKGPGAFPAYPSQGNFPNYQTPAYPTYQPRVAVSPTRGGLKTVLDEQQLKVTMLVQVVKLQPKK